MTVRPGKLDPQVSVDYFRKFARELQKITIFLQIFVLLALALTAAGCTKPAPTLSWRKANLPGLTRDAIDCAGRWYVVGTVPGPGDATRPAAWDSTDGRTWRSLTFAPLPGSYYGPQQVISSVGCSNGTVAMVGAKPGGAHGNPRVSTWRQRPDGVLAEVAATFETYGGDQAVNVGHIVGGPAGFLITGNRTSGAAVWLSPDGASFRLYENVPGLAGDATTETVARDAAPAADGRWVVVGAAARTGSLDQAPAIWLGDTWNPVTVHSARGATWNRATVHSDGGYNELQRAVQLGDDIVAVGPRGSGFGAWIGHGTQWAEAGAFGGATGTVLSLAAAGSSLFALVQIGSERALWRSTDRAGTWQQLALPGATPTAVAGRAGTVLLAADGEVWTAAL